jgi:bifunctional DNA-binding transcriptional regulator/antitoxin component of YhaV-PrlF toxin-antitoxin module
MVKVQEGSNGQKLVTIPKKLAKAMGWEKGDEITFSVTGTDSLELSG